MSFYRPYVTENQQTLLATIFSSPTNDFIVGPYDFSKEKFRKSLHPIPNDLNLLIIFNLPDEINVSIGNVHVYGTKFDYYNPLLINSQILNKIEFYDKTTRQSIHEFTCYCMTSKSLRMILEEISSTIIYYPPDFCIDYKNGSAFRAQKGRQFCDIILRTPHSPVNSQRFQDLFIQALHANIRRGEPGEAFNEVSDQPVNGQEF